VHKVQNVLHEQRFAGHVFVFLWRRGDIVKLLWWDGDGLCSVRQASGAWTLHLAEG